GVACAALLPHVTAANIRALRRRDPLGPVLARYSRAAGVLLGRHDAAGEAMVDDLVAALRELVAELDIPGLARYGLTVEDIPALAEQAMRASSTRANPIDLERAELEEAIRAAL